MLPYDCQTASIAKKKLILIFIVFILLLAECYCDFIQKKSVFILVSLCIIFLVISLSDAFTKNWLGREIKSNNKAVLITGCDTGFGFHTAKRLSEKGFEVFAGCLAPLQNGGRDLSTQNPNVHCLRMDVTSQRDVDRVSDYVKENLKDKELWAVINNAGISKGSEIEITSLERIEEVLAVNLLGTIRVTKAFLPLLRKSKGRVVNVASAAGRLVMPGFVSYSASKRAVIAFSDGLRLEMQKFGVGVVTIEPWMFSTRLSDPTGVSRHIGKQWAEAEDDIRTAYSGTYAEKAQRNTKSLFSWVMDPNIDRVIDAMEDAVTSGCPPYSYRPGRWYLNAFLTATNFFPASWLDYFMCQYVFKNR